MARLRGAMLAAFLSLAACAAEPQRGAVILTVEKPSQAESAGIGEGDLIQAWSRGDERGDVTSAFDLTELESEAARGPLTLSGLHGATQMHWKLAPAEWGIKSRPVMQATTLEKFLDGEKALRVHDRATALARWQEALADSNASSAELAWLTSMLAVELAADKRWKEADNAFAAALGRASTLGPIPSAQIRTAWASAFSGRGDFEHAREQYLKAIELRSQPSQETLALARSCALLAQMDTDRSRFPEAEEYYQRSLAIREKLAPASIELMLSLGGLATLNYRRGNLDQARDLDLKALAIVEKLEPESIRFAGILNDLGLNAYSRGDLTEADQDFGRALAIKEKLSPDSLTLANTVGNLALVATRRGDIARSDAFNRRALAIFEKIGASQLTIATTLNNLGVNALERGDAQESVDFLARALAFREKLAPDSLAVATTLHDLGNAQMELGDLNSAEQNLRRALAIREKLVPGKLPEATVLSDLAVLEHKRGNLSSAIDLTQRSLAIKEKLASGSVDVALVLNNVGTLLRKDNKIDEADAAYHRALSILDRLAPGSSLEADALAGLAVIAYKRGHLDESIELNRRATDALETQTSRLGGTESQRVDFRAQNVHTYSNYVFTLVEQGNTREAFQVLERFRAKSLLTLLAQRDLAFPADLFPEIIEQRRSNAAATDQTEAKLASLNPSTDGVQIDALLSRLRELAAERDQIAARVRETSPRLASLQYPRPLGATSAQSDLDHGTILLSYLTGQDNSLLFVVRPQSFSVHNVNAGEAALRQKVDALRDSIRQPAGASARERGVRLANPVNHSDLSQQSHELYDLLIKPAETLITSSDRIVVVPYGPLDTLPFAALLRADGHYLIDWKPLHTVISATLYSELRKTRRDARAAPVQLAAFGDPQYSSESAALARGVELAPLPFSRDEVNGIAALYPGRNHIFLGSEASEERAKGIGRDVRYLHFATHALLDEKLPLNSALVLTTPDAQAQGKENGLLQAWEVFEQMRLDADLVTLSACETGLGKETGAEGLVGLTRAFQYAGAHSVLASLWSVADASTAALMKDFYTNLRQGKPKDEALRQAQLALMRSKTYSDPFYWAPFVLSGDWK